MNRLGRLGAWCGLLAGEPTSTVREAAARLEEAGYEAIWHGEAISREAFGFGALLLSSTRRVAVASGIANIWVRDATAMRNGAITLAEAWDDRYVLGIGVSHKPLVDGRGHEYAGPLAAMRSYLQAYHGATYRGPEPSEQVPLLLSALGPKMLALSAELADGAHPYFVPVEHTTIAREALGAGKILAPEHAAVLSDDPVEARAAARHHMRLYLQLPNYRNSLRRLGWSDEELDANPDELVDAIVAWGTVDDIAGTMADHVARGADHVAVQVLPTEPGVFPLDDYVRLAPALREATGADR
jgi:probable F420-dependent oxidoreductase